MSLAIETGEVQIRVRYAECDAMGYLHHSKYLEYLEVARTELLRQNGFRYRDCEAQGVFFVVARLSVRYLKPIRYDDLVTLRTHVTRATAARIDHAYELFIDQLLTTQAETTLACVGRDGKPQMMPPQLWSEHPEAVPERPRKA